MYFKISNLNYTNLLDGMYLTDSFNKALGQKKKYKLALKKYNQRRNK